MSMTFIRKILIKYFGTHGGWDRSQINPAS